jgi:hypothetical protein
LQQERQAQEPSGRREAAKGQPAGVEVVAENAEGWASVTTDDEPLIDCSLIFGTVEIIQCSRVTPDGKGLQFGSYSIRRDRAENVVKITEPSWHGTLAWDTPFMTKDKAVWRFFWGLILGIPVWIWFIHWLAS